MELNLMEINYRSEMENIQERKNQIENAFLTQEK